jgi:hypothetical protein
MILNLYKKNIMKLLLGAIYNLFYNLYNMSESSEFSLSTSSENQMGGNIMSDITMLGCSVFGCLFCVLSCIMICIINNKSYCKK